MRPDRAIVFTLLLAVPAPAADPAAVEHFEKAVRPLLVQHCQKCHGEKAKGGLKLDSRADVLRDGDSGPAVVPGDAAKSLLVRAVQYDGELKMPPAGKLKPAEIEAVTKWVADGAVWPTADTAVSAAKPGGPLFTKEQKQFWAFQPVKRPAVPNSAPHPVDAFILAKLTDHTLTLSPPADKRALLRRVTFDLTGLPPTPDELATFEQDTSPQAFEKLVDRLLASPHYGERWGRHWLDVARYADSNGMDENTAFGHAWKYRDYVVRSLNADKPYDVFLHEQIAGDLLPPTAYEAERRNRLAALGFLAIGPKLLAEPDKQKMLLDIADEQLDTLGKSVMGLTLGCARCHDHKFDPVPTRDYYSLLAVFTSTRTMQNLNTVAKAFERTPTGPEKPEVAQTRQRLDKLRADVRKLEKQFTQVGMKDLVRRRELHEEADSKRDDIKRLEATLPPDDLFLGVEEGSAAAYGTRPRNLHVQIRGNYTTPGEEAPAVFPRILASEQQTPFVPTKPNPADKPEANKTRFGSVRERSGRLELANWLTDPKHPLTPRVIVNRVWQHHFGEGLVRTPDNFGRLGDWLATEFTQNGWSLKRLHRLILLSRTYQQSAGNPPAADPENRLLSVFPRRRLDAESLRDSMLAVADTLDRTVGGTLYAGPNLDYVREVSYDSTRRTLYLPVVRGKLFDYFTVFDFPDPGVTVGKRAVTTVAPQALYLLNNPFVRTQAEALADRVLASGVDSGRAAWLYRQVLLREPTTEEAARLTAFVAKHAELNAAERDAARRQRTAWAAACQAVFAGSEFAWLE
ncbi:MAG: PSD1 and planctomycete cytochrome C domain-containing protein [Gemmataceae bacterium]